MPLIDQTAEMMLGVTPGALSLRHLRSHEDCVALLNEEARIVALSKRGLDAVAMSPADVRGVSWWSLWPDDAQDPLRTAVERGLQGQITTYCQKAAIGEDSARDWDIRVTPVLNEADTISAVLVICQEVDTCA